MNIDPSKWQNGAKVGTFEFSSPGLYRKDIYLCRCRIWKGRRHSNTRLPATPSPPPLFSSLRSAMRSYCRRVTHPIIIIIIPFVWENVGALGEDGTRSEQLQPAEERRRTGGKTPSAEACFVHRQRQRAPCREAGREGGRVGASAARSRMLPSLPVVGCSCCEAASAIRRERRAL